VSDFVIREWTIEPYPGDQAPPHVHHRSDEAFYVLSGRLEVLIDGERRRYEGGELAFVHAGSLHTFANRGPGDARILVVMTPEVDELIAALHLHDAESAEDPAAVWARFNSSVAAAHQGP
jgi:quercetin dioxygenase-like cupin family protein